MSPVLTRQARMSQQAQDRDISTAAQVGSSTNMNQPQTPKQKTLMPPLPIVRGLGGHETHRHQRRKPSVQDMYNSWRSLKEQVEKLPRVPMFIKIESNFCHSCRIFKRRCACFDYTQLEAVFQARNTALKKKVLHQVPFTTQATTSMTNTKEPCHDEGFDFNATMSTSGQPVKEPAGTPVAYHTRMEGNNMVKFRRQPVVLAREKIGANTRRWRCQFGSGTPGSPVCTREDENMETIRRHYGREHGRHRYYKKPIVEIKCSSCRYSVGNQRPPFQCPACKTPHSIWLREMSAVVEIPVPLTESSGSEAASLALAVSRPPSTPQPAASSAGATRTAPVPTITVQPPSMDQFQLDYSSASYLASTAVPFDHPLTPLSPGKPLTPETRTPITATTSPAFSPLGTFSPEINSDASVDAMMRSLFPSAQQSGLGSNYTASMSYVSDACRDSVNQNSHSNYSNYNSYNNLASQATTQTYSGLYNSALDPALVMQVPSDGMYPQQPYIDLTGPATAHDSLQMLDMMKTDFSNFL